MVEVTCPIDGCDRTGEVKSIEGHISGTTTGDHKGQVGRNYREELVEQAENILNHAESEEPSEELAEEELAEVAEAEVAENEEFESEESDKDDQLALPETDEVADEEVGEVADEDLAGEVGGASSEPNRHAASLGGITLASTLGAIGLGAGGSADVQEGETQEGFQLTGTHFLLIITLVIVIGTIYFATTDVQEEPEDVEESDDREPTEGGLI